MRDNPVMFLLDLTEIHNTYYKEIAALLDMGVDTREIMIDMILDNEKYISILKRSSGTVLKATLINKLLVGCGKTKLPYREVVNELMEYNIEMFVFSTLGFLLETLLMPIKDTCINKNEKRYQIGVPRVMSNFTILVPVNFGDIILTNDALINI